MKKVALFLKNWLSMKSTKTSIVLLIAAIVGFGDGNMNMNDLVDKITLVIGGLITAYLMSNIGEGK